VWCRCGSGSAGGEVLQAVAFRLPPERQEHQGACQVPAAAPAVLCVLISGSVNYLSLQASRVYPRSFSGDLSDKPMSHCARMGCVVAAWPGPSRRSTLTSMCCSKNLYWPSFRTVFSKLPTEQLEVRQPGTNHPPTQPATNQICCSTPLILIAHTATCRLLLVVIYGPVIDDALHTIHVADFRAQLLL
jgi:hypothetical protein